MKTPNVLNVTMIAAGCAIASQVALAFSAGDMPVPGGITQFNVDVDTESLAINRPGLENTGGRGLYDETGYLHHDKLGIEVSGGPYESPGVDYVYFSGQALDALNLRHMHGSIDPSGVDLAVARGHLRNDHVSYADVSADMPLVVEGLSEKSIDPTALGGRVTYRF